MIPFNQPPVTGREAQYIAEAIAAGKLSGDGPFTKRAQAELERRLGRGRSYLTTSCTDALEAAALLSGVSAGDEVLVPSFTFVSTANAFALRGAQIRFVDSLSDNPNMDVEAAAGLITERTRAIVPVHYAGVACDMDAVLELARRHDLVVVEDAAQAIDSFYRGRALGTIGTFGAFSFHETKNIVCGEGGALHVNDPAMARQTEIVREKGTDRSAFFRGEVDKYGWVALGSSYLPSELVAAYLLSQLEELESIQARRRAVWDIYANGLAEVPATGRAQLPSIPVFATNNAHMFYLVCDSGETRDGLIDHLAREGIKAVFHYQALHSSKYQRDSGQPLVELPQATRYSETLVRLPLYAGLGRDDAERIVESTLAYFRDCPGQTRN